MSIYMPIKNRTCVCHATVEIACAMYLIFPVALLAYTGLKHENEAHPRPQDDGGQHGAAAVGSLPLQPLLPPPRGRGHHPRVPAQCLRRVGHRPCLLQLHHPSGEQRRVGIGEGWRRGGGEAQ